jgi:creatinine amidohydrolase/Fe(II)-dependent formamide hydrolase-like protein
MNSIAMRIFSHLTRLLFIGLTMFVSQAFAQIYHVKEMNTEQIKALDREKTVVLLPGGILEEHGPYLPSFSDGYTNERLTNVLANAIVERPVWKVLIFPLIPLGTSPANTLGRKYVFPGSYTVRPSTLRAVFMDLATDLGEQGFRWIFVVHLHLAPSHSRALNQAGDYFHDTYGGHMISLMALLPPQRRPDTRSEEEQREDAASTHAGVSETNTILFLRPDLVSPAYKNALSLPARDQKHRVEIAKADDWPGYWGSPRLATAAAGAARWKNFSSRWVDLALKILDGFDYRQMKRLGDEIPPPAGPSVDGKTFTQHNQEIEGKLQEWLKQKGLE